jgi:hypothetical protein
MPTKTELETEVSQLQARVAELESSTEIKEEPKEPSKFVAPIQIQVADWLTTTWGREVNPQDIVFTDVRRHGVAYRLQSSINVLQILTLKENSMELIKPTPHEHEYKALKQGSHPSCSCGKAEPEKVL